MIVAEKLTWHEARQRCQAFFGELASIGSKQDEERIKRLISGFSHGAVFWIGLNDIEIQERFVWSDGTSYSYSSWNDGEPNNLGNEDCINTDTSMKWNDALCGLREFFACSVPIA